MQRECMGATGLTFSHGADGCGFSVVRPQCNSALETREVAVELGVAHGQIMPLLAGSGLMSPTENPEEPIKVAG